jgi:cephalosporin hydroxylase
MPLDDLLASVRLRLRNSQSGIHTYFDRWVVDHCADPGSEERRWLETFAERLEQGRFVEFADRIATATDIPDRVMITSQGTQGPMRWKGLALFKSAFDLALYTQLLGEMRPKTIFEIGSGSGASAIWFADMCRALEIGCEVLSVDRRGPAVTYAGVTFVEGDCGEIARIFPAEILARAGKPILLIEDAHQHVGLVLAHFAPHMQRGDRIVIEDSDGKQEILRNFTASCETFHVDTFYTDFFGTNATSAMNSFLVRV